METSWIIWATIGVYIILMLGLGLAGARKTEGLASFTVGKRNAGAWLTALSYGTAYFSAVMFVGYAGSSGWSYGIWAVLVGLGNAILGSYAAWKLLARRTRAVSHAFHIKSMSQLFQIRYGSSRMKRFSSIVIFLFLVPYSASVYKGLTSICSVLLGVDANLCMLIIALVSAALLLIGGYLATIKADFVQGIIMMVGVALLIFFVLRSPTVTEGGGIAGLWQYMKDSGMQPMSGSMWVSLMATVLMTSIGTWGLPQMIHKYYGIKDEHEVKRGTVISTFFALLVSGGGYFIGSFSHLFFGSELPAGGVDYVVPEMLARSALPTVLLGVVLVLLIAASVSTLSSITLTAGTTVTIDLLKSSAKKARPDKQWTLFIKLFCLVFVAASYIIAQTDTPILDMMSYSWGILSGAFLAPYMLALYYKGMTRTGAWTGMLGGFIVAIVPALSKLLCYVFPSAGLLQALAGQGPLFAVIAMAASFLLCLIGSALSRKDTLPDGFYESMAHEKA